MTKLRLSKRWQDVLLALPETGMGYQRLEVCLKDGRIVKDVIVENCEHLSSNVPFEESDLMLVKLQR